MEQKRTPFGWVGWMLIHAVELIWVGQAGVQIGEMVVSNPLCRATLHPREFSATVFKPSFSHVLWRQYEHTHVWRAETIKHLSASVILANREGGHHSPNSVLPQPTGNKHSSTERRSPLPGDLWLWLIEANLAKENHGKFKLFPPPFYLGLKDLNRSP